MNIDTEMVDYIAELSRLELQTGEKQAMTAQLEQIIAYMNVLNKLDTTGVEPMSHVFPVKNVLREDEVVPSQDRAELLAGAPVPDTVDGSSLLGPVDRPWLHGEHALGRDSMHFIVTRADKFIWYSQTGEELYFDLERDPHETHNAVRDPDRARRVDQLRNWLVQALAGREEGYTDGARLIPGRPPKTVLSHVKRG